MRIDLHLHSTASDGKLTPSELVRAARTGSLDIIALTDHDTAHGVPDAVREAGTSPIVIPGIEVSSTHAGNELHFLGYFIDPRHAALEAYRNAAIDRRHERMRGMIARLEALNVHVTYDEVLATAGPTAGALGRPHLARVLLERGYVNSFSEAFDRFLADGGPASLPTDLLTPREAIDLIHDVGGLAVWAHPPYDTLEHELRRFVTWGLDGIECFRPRNTPADIDRLRNAAARFDLLTTGGSDWHGGWHGELGTFHIGPAEIAAFLERGGL